MGEVHHEWLASCCEIHCCCQLDLWSLVVLHLAVL